MEARGIKYVHAYCVDNCLVKVADPVFLGYAIEKGSECGAKVVRKTYPKESVGVLAVKGGKYNVVEYSELSEREAEMKDEKTGELSFRAANIANHYFTLDFLKKMEKIEEGMAFHIARKKIAHVDIKSGEIVKPSKPNGMKLELFVFDVFPYTEHLAVLEVARQEEFSPLKNAPGTGSDDPETSRRDILQEHARWLKAAGCEIAQAAEVEISASVSYAGEGLESLKGKSIKSSLILNDVKDI
jgi:UDP-N-acetylglucosamine/UDP-N-acetylgalactosamine diphosphorylase